MLLCVVVILVQPLTRAEIGKGKTSHGQPPQPFTLVWVDDTNLHPTFLLHSSRQKHSHDSMAGGQL